MKIFITGGCKNGKSHYAQRLAKAQCTDEVRLSQSFESPGSLYYVATMKPADIEDTERISRHRLEREGWGFTTIEQQTDIEQILKKCDPGSSFLLDSLTALLANEMFLSDSGVNEHAAEKITNGLQQIFKVIKNIVIVSDFIYSNSEIYDPLTTLYIKSLAQTDRITSVCSDAVLEIAYSNVIIHKGRELFEKLHEKIF